MTIRDDIYNVVNAVSGTGNVYSYKRYARSLYNEQLDVFKVTIDDEEKLQGFDIQAGPVTSERMIFRDGDGGGLLRNHTFFIHGYVTWDDADASETAARVLAVAVQKALDDSDTLHDGNTYYNALPAQITNLEGRRFANILVNYIGITQVVQEYTA